MSKNDYSQNNSQNSQNNGQNSEKQAQKNRSENSSQNKSKNSSSDCHKNSYSAASQLTRRTPLPTGRRLFWAKFAVVVDAEVKTT